MTDLNDVLEKYVGNRSLPGAVGLVTRGDRAEVAAVGLASVGGRPMARDSIFRIAGWPSFRRFRCCTSPVRDGSTTPARPCRAC